MHIFIQDSIKRSTWGEPGPRLCAEGLRIRDTLSLNRLSQVEKTDQVTDSYKTILISANESELENTMEKKKSEQ